MALLIVTAAAVIVFLLVEGNKKIQPPSPPTGEAGAAGGGSDFAWNGGIAPFRPSQEAFQAMLSGQQVDLTQLSPAEQANFASLFQSYNGG